MAFTQWILIKIPTVALCLIFVGGSALLTSMTLLMVRRFVPHTRLKQHNDVTGAVLDIFTLDGLIRANRLTQEASHAG